MKVENVCYRVVVGVLSFRAVAFAEADVWRCRCDVGQFFWWIFPPARHPFIQEVSRRSPVSQFAGDVECRDGNQLGVV